MVDFGIIIPTCQRHRKFFKPMLEQCNKTDTKKIIVICDKVFTANRSFSLDKALWDTKIFNLADTWIFNESCLSMGMTFIRQQLYGLGVLIQENVEYVLSLNGDCILGKPEGLNDLFKILLENDGDILSSFKGKGFIGTMGYIAKVEAASKIVKWIYENRFNKKIVRNVTTEGLFNSSCNVQNIKNIDVENQVGPHFSCGTKGTWFNLVEFRHLHGTEKWRNLHHHKPLPEKFYDIRYCSPTEQKVFPIFWETGKTDHLVEMGYWRENPVKPELIEKFGEDI